MTQAKRWRSPANDLAACKVSNESQGWGEAICSFSNNAEAERTLMRFSHWPDAKASLLQQPASLTGIQVHRLFAASQGNRLRLGHPALVMATTQHAVAVLMSKAGLAISRWAVAVARSSQAERAPAPLTPGNRTSGVRSGRGRQAPSGRHC